MRPVLLSCLLLPSLVWASRFYTTKNEQEINTETLNVNIQVNFLLTPLIKFNIPVLNSTLQKVTGVTISTATYKPLAHIIENIQRHTLAIFKSLIERNHFYPMKIQLRLPSAQLISPLSRKRTLLTF